MATGDKVQVIRDSDGAVEQVGTIKEVYKSGRCCVEFENGQFRNFAAKDLRAVN